MTQNVPGAVLLNGVFTLSGRSAQALLREGAGSVAIGTCFLVTRKSVHFSIK